jgi:predicted secreted protein
MKKYGVRQSEKEDHVFSQSRGRKATMRALLMAGGLALCLVGISGPAAQAAEPMQTLLTLHESAETLVAPDMVSVTLRAEADGTDVATPQRALNRTVAAALAKARGVEGVTIATGPYYTNRTDPTAKAAAYPVWRATQTIELTSRRFDVLLALAGDLQSDGLAMVAMEYMVSAEARAAVHETLVTEAFAALRQEASLAARATGLTVVGYKTLSLSPSGRPPVVMKAARGMAMAMDRAAPPQGEAAAQSVRVDVDAEVVLELRHAP